jgi:Phage derived protein Gp49-like (DUF891)
MGKHVPRSKRLVERGVWGTVEYATRTNGDLEAKVWLEKQPQVVQSSFVHLFRVHANGHRITNEQQFRQLTSEIFEYKRGGNRIFTFQHQRTWFLTHHYKKNGPNKCPRRVIKRAEVIRIECLAILQLETEGDSK